MEERMRLARDLHDGVLQSLTGIGLRLAAARTQIAEAPAEARAALESLQRLITLEQRDLRFFIRDLKPTLVAPAGELPRLSDRLAELVQRTELEWGLRAELRTDGLPEAIPEPLAREVYLVVREALVNAVRHGEATAVRVEVGRMVGGAAGLAVSVMDNGKGFPFQGRFREAELLADDRGPRTLLSRVTALGGTLTLDSSLSGARFEIALPYEGGP
jgi:signal transduction histidine kinase